MRSLGRKKIVELPCPDSLTEAKCPGRVKVSIRHYRIARGRGAFALSVADESEICKCGTCGRNFTYKNDAQQPGMIVFSPF